MLTQVIPSYVYQQYNDDPNIVAFANSFNALAQEYVDWFNQVSLPVYTGPLLVGSLLDWVANGLYGIIRPTLTAGIPVTDDVFQRVISWHFYKGDGKVFDVRWLKRRIMRFLIGVNGTDPGINQTYQISVRFPSPGVVDINVFTGTGYQSPQALFNGSQFNTRQFNDSGLIIKEYVDTTLAPILQQAINAGVLELPFQYQFIVSIAP